MVVSVLVEVEVLAEASVVVDVDVVVAIVVPVKVADLLSLAVSVISTGGVPSADVIESVVTPVLPPGLITRPSSGMLVFC